MITSIQLTNWRSHEDSRLEFSKGTNLIIGIMGSGKSSVTDAMCFALFGNFPALAHRKLKLSDIIRSRPSQESSAKVELNFEMNGVKYSVLRTVNLEGNTEAEARKEGKLLEGPQPKRVNELLENLLSIDYDLFTRAIYSEQNNLDYFLELQRGDRKRQIDQLLGIDRFETVRAELVKTTNMLKSMRAEKESLIKEADRGKTERELEKSRGEKEKLNSESKGVLAALSSLAPRKTSLEEKLKQMEAQRAEHRRLSEKKAGLSHTIESSCKQLSCKPEELEEKKLAQENASIREQLKKKKEELTALELSLERFQAEIAGQRSRLREAQEKTERRAKLEKELAGVLVNRSPETLEKELASLSESINSRMEEQGKLRAKAMDGLEANKELEKGEGKCPVCESALTPERKAELMKKRSAELKELAERMKALEKEIELKTASLRKTQEELSKAKALQAKLSEVTVEFKKEDAEKFLSEAEARKRETDLKIKSARDSSSTLEESLRSAESKLRLVSMLKEFSELEKKLSASQFEEKGYELARSELENVRISEGEARAKRDGLEREAKRVEETIRLQTEKLSQLDSHADSVKTIDSSLQQLSVFQNCVIDTQRELREELITAINSTMTGVWGSLYPYADYREIRLKADDKGYELEARIGDNWISVDGIASGGERAAACLALRIAFAMVLVPNLNWLILDEPTHNLDEEAVHSLARTLYEKIPEIVEQTFVITHDENLKDAASGSLHRISRNKGENEPSRIEKL